MNIISKARRLAAKHGGVSAASAILGIPRSTLRDWLSAPAKKKPKTTPKTTPHEAIPTGQWMQSLHHESAHFVTLGHSACDGSSNGARVVAGMQWFPHDGCLRKCQRCLKHAAA